MRKFSDNVRFVWVIFCLCFITVILIIPIVVSGIFTRRGFLAFNLMRVWAWAARKSSSVKVIISGKENIRKMDKRKSYVIVSNHQSLYDIPALMALNLQLRWVIKKELLWIPLFGMGLYFSRNIFIDRSNHKKAIQQLHTGIDRLPPGVHVLFFPEGTRSKDGSIKSFKKGGFVLAIDKDLPILPITINGSRRILSKKSSRIQPGTIEVVVGEPISAHRLISSDLDRLITQTRDAIISRFNPDFK